MLPKNKSELLSDGKSSDLGFGSGLSSDNGFQSNYVVDDFQFISRNTFFRETRRIRPFQIETRIYGQHRLLEIARSVEDSEVAALVLVEVLEEGSAADRIEHSENWMELQGLGRD